ncbi:hypothetical protein [Limimaricola hongkongensis]|uniref:Uncharacterized protein n=1 Tax=Limimaricola hongkongensis DSM 17492 TaxID=1122180 RepID=A0A017H9A4_9RHOB|nr:hypothetical protein [Limimaricola hongkongensis]EYD70379.1 hypothetical protein Lokhon_00133 [Limimaricola hongkongensis DSM 17492]
MKMFVMSAALVGAVGVGTAQAETISVEGVGKGTPNSMQMPVGEGMMVVHNQVEYDGFETTDPDSPFASLSGPCFGAALVDVGAMQGSGYCHYSDADGDMAVMEWTVTGMGEEGRITGDWMVRGGTGKWAEAEGGGTFDAGGEGGDYTNMVTGEVTMP